MISVICLLAFQDLYPDRFDVRYGIGSGEIDGPKNSYDEDGSWIELGLSWDLAGEETDGGITRDDLYALIQELRYGAPSSGASESPPPVQDASEQEGAPPIQVPITRAKPGRPVPTISEIKTERFDKRDAAASAVAGAAAAAAAIKFGPLAGPVIKRLVEPILTAVFSMFGRKKKGKKDAGQGQKD
jgi:hypothetical protein